MADASAAEIPVPVKLALMELLTWLKTTLDGLEKSNLPVNKTLLKFCEEALYILSITRYAPTSNFFIPQKINTESVKKLSVKNQDRTL